LIAVSLKIRSPNDNRPLITGPPTTASVVLRYRLLLGALFIAAFGALCWLDQTRAAGAPRGAWLFPLAILLSIPASGEILWLTTNENRRPAPWLVYVGNLAIVAASGIGMFWPSLARSISIGEFGWPLAAFTLMMALAFVVEMYRYDAPGRSIANLSATLLALAYVGLLFVFLVALPGLIALVSLIAVVKMGDTGAYTVGRLIGRHKMTPRLSPGKTWEGAAGAVLFAIFGAWLVFGWLAPWLNASGSQTIGPWRWIAYGVIVGIAGLLGDLAESLLKRDAGWKDSSHWMPGFGGVLDVLDSILFAAPIAYFCWATGLVR
jgi:phosphatidate cytidylyltransferase